MTRLGLRLIFGGGRGSVVGIALTALAVAIGTAILLFALSFRPAFDDRAQRSAWRSPTQFAVEPDGDDATLLVQAGDDAYQGESLFRFTIAALVPDAPLPPGLVRLPSPGEAYVSPALATRIAAVPGDELGDRFGTVIGTIGDEALRSPQELVVIVGMDSATLRVSGSPITGFETDPPSPEIPAIGVLMIVLAVIGAITPVAVFVATATRLSAARREERLAALRLAGATPGQVRRLAMVEALIATTGGAALGLLLFFITRPLVAMVPLDGAGWFPGAIQPPLAQAATMLGLIPVVGAVAALVALRRVVVTPLGVQRRQTPPKPGPARALPLIGALLLLVVAMALTRGRGAETTLLLLGGAFGGVLIGIFLVGPWLTASIGTILGWLPGGASTLLAARRLSDDPRGSFGSIAGVIMAVFVAAAFFTFTGYAATLEFDRAGAIHPDQVFAELPFGEGPTLVDLPAQLAAMPGTRNVASIAAGELFVDGSPVIAWVADCPTLVTQFELPSSACDGGPVHAVNGGTDWLIGTSSFTSDRGDRLPIDLEIRRREASTFEVGDMPSANQLPDVILDPSLFATAARQPALSRLYVTTDGSSAAAERVRTAIDVAAPAAFVRLTDESRSSNNVYAEFRRVVALGLAGSLVLAGCSLAVAVTTGILDRRRQFALLRSAGMPVSRLRALVLLQAGVPLITIALFSAALGVAVAQIVLRFASDVAVPLPDPSLLAILAISLLGAMAIVAGTLPSLERLTRPEGLRVE